MRFAAPNNRLTGLALLALRKLRALTAAPGRETAPRRRRGCLQPEYAGRARLRPVVAKPLAVLMADAGTTPAPDATDPDDDDAGKTVRGNAKSNNTKNGNTFGDATMGGAMTERKSSSSNIDPRRTITSSLFTAQKSLQDLVRVLGLTNAANAPSVEQMAHRQAP